MSYVGQRRVWCNSPVHILARSWVQYVTTRALGQRATLTLGLRLLVVAVVARCTVNSTVAGDNHTWVTSSGTG